MPTELDVDSINCNLFMERMQSVSRKIRFDRVLCSLSRDTMNPQPAVLPGAVFRKV